jgi:hypothetical protein
VNTIVEALGRLFDEYRSLQKVMKDVTSCVGSQYRKGWRF